MNINSIKFLDPNRIYIDNGGSSYKLETVGFGMNFNDKSNSELLNKVTEADNFYELLSYDLHRFVFIII